MCPPKVSAMAQKKKKILIIDDEGDLTEMLALRLEHEGFDVVAANSGLVGLKKAKEFRPDAVLLDILMPEMDGWTVCKKLKEDPVTQNASIIFFTVLERQKVELERNKQNCAAARIVTKPFNKDELILILREEVGR